MDVRQAARATQSTQLGGKIHRVLVDAYVRIAADNLVQVEPLISVDSPRATFDPTVTTKITDNEHGLVFSGVVLHPR